jgi:hypothetical protein
MKEGETMKKMTAVRLIVQGLALAAGLAMAPTLANAQATRTWVSGVGDDANPCSRTAPCKTFAGAISKTAAGGEINVLDPGGFGGVTITKSITILNDGAVAGVLVSGTNGILVNAAATDVIVLKGLDIEGLGTGLAGVRFNAGAALHIYDSIIRNFKGASPNGYGVQFTPSTAAELYISNTIIANNGASGTGGGILVRPTGSGNANVNISNSNIDNNQAGIVGDGSGGATAMNITVRNTIVHGNALNGVLAVTPGGGSRVQVNLDQATITGNVGSGVRVDAASASGLGSATIRIGRSNISSNVTGVSIAGSGVLQSYKDNEIAGNATDGTPITQINQN